MGSVLEDILQLLNSIASDLDVMLNDLCKNFPYPGSEAPPHTPGDRRQQLADQIARETGLLEQYVRGAEEDEDESSGDSMDGTTSERTDRSPSVATNSSGETFFSLDGDEQGSEGAVAGSDPDSPTPILSPHPLPAPPQGLSSKQGVGKVVDPLGHRTISIADRLIWTHPVWYLPNVGRTGAIHLLQNREEGTFLVRQSSKKDTMALSIRVGKKPAVEHYLIESSPSQNVHIEGSNEHFTAIPLLIAHYCQCVVDLPVLLVLPPVVMEAASQQELTSLALLGQEFWTSSISYSKPATKKSVLHTTVAPYGMGNSIPRTPVTMEITTVTTTTTANNSARNVTKDNKTEKVSEFTKRLQKLQMIPCDISPTEPGKSQKLLLDSVKPILNETTSASSLSTFTRTTTATVNSTNTAQINHKQSSAFRRVKPATPDAAYYRGSLSHRLSDYEDIWDSPSPQNMPESFFKPIPGSDAGRFSHVNPGYTCNSDSSMERCPPKVPQRHRVPKSTEHVEEKQVTHIERLVPPGLKGKNEAVIFTFDMPSSSSLDRNVPRERQSREINRTSDHSNCSTLQTQFSSPKYFEPADSLLGKIPGISNSKGAIRVNNVLSVKQKPVPPPIKTSHHHSFVHPGATSNRDSVNTVYQSPLDSVRLQEQRDKVCGINRSQSLKALAERMERPKDDHAQSLPKQIKDLKEREHEKSVSPQQPVIPEHQPTVAQRPSPQRPPSLAESQQRAPVISKSFEDHFFQPHSLTTVEEQSNSLLHRFPVDQSPNSDQASFSESSTAEDQLMSISPELTLRPLKPLTQRNLQRISDYDNIAGMCTPSSRRTANTSSVCTQYCTPWDSDLWDNLLNMPTPGVPPPHFPYPPQPDPFTPELATHIPLHMAAPVDHASEPDYTSVYSETDAGGDRPLSSFSIGSLAPANSFVWHVKPDRDSAAETTPQPVDPEPLDHVFPERVVDSPDSEDEGVEDPDPGASFPNKLMPFLSTPRLISLRRRGSANPGFRVRDYISDLASTPYTTFGKTVENFIQCTKEGQENNPHIVVRNVRQFMNGIKNYLVQNGEGELNHLIERERSKLGSNEFLNIDAIIEGALHKCVVRPLKQYIYGLFIEEYKSNGNLKMMSDNMKYARTKTPQELGIKQGLLPPQGTSLEVVKHFLSKMQKAYSPLKKLENLLGATSSIYNTVEGYRGPGSSQDSVSLGADDFLPMFIYVLVQDGLVTAEIEADYMWGLLHPCLLAGEGGYYLTTLSSAVHILKNIKISMETSESQESILPSLGDLQGFMKIIIPDEKNDSIITKTLPVRPNMTTRDVCNMIAHKFRITNPQDYGLYVLVMGIEEKLSDTACPQTLKTDILRQGRECIFAFKRNNAKFVWPVDFTNK